MPMQEDLVSGVRPSILALFGAVTFVLLIACANVANLLIVRASARHRELVIRAAIGGSQWRLIRQMLTESCVLAVLGGGLGLLLAQSGIDLLIAMGPAKLPRINSISIDPAVLAFTRGGHDRHGARVRPGACPSRLAPGSGGRAALERRIAGIAGRPGAPQQRGRRRSRAVVRAADRIGADGAQLHRVAARRRRLRRVERPHLRAAGAAAPGRRAVAFLRQVTERLRAIPGVLGVTAATPLPLDGGSQNVPWATEAGASDPSAFRQANFHNVRPGYFETLRTKLLAGRTFTEEDNVAGTTKVIIDDMLAARAFPGATAVGRTLLMRNLRPNGPNAPQNERVEVIGVVAHQRHESLVERRTRSDLLRRKLLRPRRRRPVGHPHVGSARIGRASRCALR